MPSSIWLVNCGVAALSCSVVCAGLDAWPIIAVDGKKNVLIELCNAQCPMPGKNHDELDHVVAISPTPTGYDIDGAVSSGGVMVRRRVPLTIVDGRLLRLEGFRDIPLDRMVMRTRGRDLDLVGVCGKSGDDFRVVMTTPTFADRLVSLLSMPSLLGTIATIGETRAAMMVTIRMLDEIADAQAGSKTQVLSQDVTLGRAVFAARDNGVDIELPFEIRGTNARLLIQTRVGPEGTGQLHFGESSAIASTTPGAPLNVELEQKVIGALLKSEVEKWGARNRGQLVFTGGGARPVTFQVDGRPVKLDLRVGALRFFEGGSVDQPHLLIETHVLPATSGSSGKKETDR